MTLPEEAISRTELGKPAWPSRPSSFSCATAFVMGKVEEHKSPMTSGLSQLWPGIPGHTRVRCVDSTGKHSTPHTVNPHADWPYTCVANLPPHWLPCPLSPGSLALRYFGAVTLFPGIPFRIFPYLLTGAEGSSCQWSTIVWSDGIFFSEDNLFPSKRTGLFQGLLLWSAHGLFVSVMTTLHDSTKRQMLHLSSSFDLVWFDLI